VNGTMPVPSKVRAPVPVGLSRERLETSLARLEAYRLALVVAPAGSGKTTLLAQLAAVTGVPTAWYRAEIWDRDEPALVGHLRVALRSATSRSSRSTTCFGRWTTGPASAPRW
jgi:ATP/maltotriose-dependent transcriptional regulator MalT